MSQYPGNWGLGGKFCGLAIPALDLTFPAKNHGRKLLKSGKILTLAKPIERNEDPVVFAANGKEIADECILFVFQNAGCIPLKINCSLNRSTMVQKKLGQSHGPGHCMGGAARCEQMPLTDKLN